MCDRPIHPSTSSIPPKLIKPLHNTVLKGRVAIWCKCVRRRQMHIRENPELHGTEEINWTAFTYPITPRRTWCAHVQLGTWTTAIEVHIVPTARTTFYHTDNERSTKWSIWFTAAWRHFQIFFQFLFMVDFSKMILLDHSCTNFFSTTTSTIRHVRSAHIFTRFAKSPLLILSDGWLDCLWVVNSDRKLLWDESTRSSLCCDDRANGQLSRYSKS